MSIRKITFHPAWDRTAKDPKENYGISDVTITFDYVKNGKCVELWMGTGWHLPHVQKRRQKGLRDDILSGTEEFLWERYCKPFIYEVALYAVDNPINGDWFLFDDIGPKSICWHLTRLLGAKDLYYCWLPKKEKMAYDILVREGEEALWNYLELLWGYHFNE